MLKSLWCLIFMILLLPVTNEAQSPGNLERIVSSEVCNVFGCGEKTFHISLLWPPKDKPVTVYGKTIKDDPIEIGCEHNVSLSIIESANVRGHIWVGVCTKNLVQLDEVAARAEDIIKSAFSPSASRSSNQALQIKVEDLYEKATLREGITMTYFVTFVGGHGVATLPTVFAFSKQRERAVMIQYYIEDYNLCQQRNKRLCDSPKEVLRELAPRLLSQFDKM